MFVCSVSRSVDNIVSLYNCVVLLVDYFVAVNRCWYVTLTRYFVSSLTSTFSHVLLRSQPLVRYRTSLIMFVSQLNLMDLRHVTVESTVERVVTSRR